jgi:anti-sigma regulatory factor (Ser/Thr protein kinase)
MRIKIKRTVGGYTSERMHDLATSIDKNDTLLPNDIARRTATIVQEVLSTMGARKLSKSQMFAVATAIRELLTNTIDWDQS